MRVATSIAVIALASMIVRPSHAQVDGSFVAGTGVNLFAFVPGGYAHAFFVTGAVVESGTRSLSYGCIEVGTDRGTDRGCAIGPETTSSDIDPLLERGRVAFAVPSDDGRSMLRARVELVAFGPFEVGDVSNVYTVSAGEIGFTAKDEVLRDADVIETGEITSERVGGGALTSTGTGMLFQGMAGSISAGQSLVADTALVRSPYGAPFLMHPGGGLPGTYLAGLSGDGRYTAVINWAGNDPHAYAAELRDVYGSNTNEFYFYNHEALFVYDRVTDRTTMDSIVSDDLLSPVAPVASLNGGLEAVEISLNGRYVKYCENYVEYRCFWRDRLLQQTSQTQPPAWGTCTGADWSFERYLIEETVEPLVPEDNNASLDVYRLDRDVDADGVLDEAGATRHERASVLDGDIEIPNGGNASKVSCDGKVVAFELAGAAFGVGTQVLVRTIGDRT
jgi:hypothetical protein